jgi:hypothetical protein
VDALWVLLPRRSKLIGIGVSIKVIVKSWRFFLFPCWWVSSFFVLASTSTSTSCFCSLSSSSSHLLLHHYAPFPSERLNSHPFRSIDFQGGVIYDPSPIVDEPFILLR